MSTFEPSVVRKLLAASKPLAERQDFFAAWDKSVSARVNGWLKKQDQSKASRKSSGDEDSYVLSEAQLHWSAAVVEYVDFVHKTTRIHGSSKTALGPPALPESVPLLGPRFVPPSPGLVHVRRGGRVTPESWYLRPMTIVHAFFFPSMDLCPACNAGKGQISWQGWSTALPRRVHGLFTEELAFGHQLRCKACDPTSKTGKSYMTTSQLFWKSFHHYEIPDGIPVFTHKCALTRELYDLIIQLRPSSTSSGIASQIKQLHLQRYFKDKHEYLSLVQTQQKATTLSSFFQNPAAQPLAFSDPKGGTGYALNHVSGDMVTLVYLEFVQRTRRAESERYLKSLYGAALSIDNTFKITNKATVVSKETAERLKPLKGGLLSTINEHGKIIAWRFCQSQSTQEIEDQHAGLRRRFDLLGVARPHSVTADNCCHVRTALVAAWVTVAILLDNWHLIHRYFDQMAGGKSNAYRGAVAREIAESIIKVHADKRHGVRSEYWTKEDQLTRLDATFKKWLEKGGVWLPGAEKVHKTQMAHVLKGCLAHGVNGLTTDGSRIESTHKDWNSLMRIHASGVEMLTALATDFVLRRNIRIATANKTSRFAVSTFGCHHVSLVESTNELWNSIMAGCAPPGSIVVDALPLILSVDSGEKFGLVWSEYSALPDPIKEEIGDVELIPTLDMGDIDLRDEPALTQAIQEPLVHGPNAVIDLTKDADELPQSIAATSAQLRVKRRHEDPSNPPQTAKRARTEASPPLTAATDAAPPASAALAQASSSTFPHLAAHAAPRSAGTASAGPARLSAATEPAPTPAAAVASRPPTATESTRPGSVRPPVATGPTRPPTATGFATAPGRPPTATAPGRPPTATAPARPLTATAPARPPTATGSATALARPPTATGSARLPAAALLPGIPRIPTLSSHAVHVAAAGHTAMPAAMLSHAPATPTRAPTIPHPAAAQPARVAANPSPAVGLASATSATSPDVGKAPHRNLAPIFQRSGLSSGAPAIPAVVNPQLPGPAQLQAVAQPQRPAMTRSELVFATQAGIAASALIIEKWSREWFVLMDVRIDLKLRSFDMSAAKLTEATSSLNERVNTLQPPGQHKHSRAIAVALGQIEELVLQRLAKQDFTSSSSGKTEFWTKHCTAVDMGTVLDSTGKKRKVNTCSRCLQVMWAHARGDPRNHKKQCCSDGVNVALKDIVLYPQPPGIFLLGKQIHVGLLVKAIAALYGAQSSQQPLCAEYQHFALLVQKNLTVSDDRALFLVPDKLDVVPAGSVVQLPDGRTAIDIPMLSTPHV